MNLVHPFECSGQYNVVSWISANDHYKVGILACKGLQLVESVNTNRYNLVATEVVETLPILNVTETKTNVDIIVGCRSNWLILPIGPKVRRCISCEGFSVPL